MVVKQLYAVRQLLHKYFSRIYQNFKILLLNLRNRYFEEHLSMIASDIIDHMY